jgi:hypothetical protein
VAQAARFWGTVTTRRLSYAPWHTFTPAPASQQAQPFNRPGINIGSDIEEGLNGYRASAHGGGAPSHALADVYEAIAADPFAKGISSRRLQLGVMAGREALLALVAKADAAHAALLAAHPRVRRVLGGADAEDDSELRSRAMVSLHPGRRLCFGRGVHGGSRQLEQRELLRRAHAHLVTAGRPAVRH